MNKSDDSLKAVISHAKAYGFIFPSSHIYEGISALYDYGPYGVVLKNHLKSYWWEAMVGLRRNIVGLDSAIFMHPIIWKASGHIDSFHDPFIENKDSGSRYRADVLIEEYCEKLQKKIDEELAEKVMQCRKNFLLYTPPKLLAYQEKKQQILQRLAQYLEAGNLLDLKKLIDELDISEPNTGSKNWSNIRQYNLMFHTQIGTASVKENSVHLYLRPETAQGIFVNFSQVQKSMRMKIPFGIAQIGKAFRNEIIARQFIFRMREFEQMEMQFFIHPSEEVQWYKYWKKSRLNWHLALGLGSDKYRFYDHKKLAHYAHSASDIEFCFPFGFKELEGIHSRTDFDLKNHQKYSKKKMHYFDSKTHESYVPYVIETSVGLDRLFLGVFSSSLCEESLENGSTRHVLKLPPSLSPIKAAILPLVKKDGLPEMAIKIFHDLKWRYSLIFEEQESIGKRYRRQDAIGTPFCCTIDYESLQDQSITIRYRDSMKQKRIPIAQLTSLLEEETSMEKILKTGLYN